MQMDGILGAVQKAQFAGHETFPLRLLWLKKAFDAVEGGVPTGYFHLPEAIGKFGVGRNMAVAIRFWALAAGMITERDRMLTATEVGHHLLSEAGWDPFIEHPATLWLVHWAFASSIGSTTTIYFAFNSVRSMEFDSAMLVAGLEQLVEKQGWRASHTTLKRDVEVFFRSYVRRDEASTEETLEPLMAELGLVRSLRPGQWYSFVRGPKPTLPDGIFAYALAQFWQRRSPDVSTLSFEQICYSPGSPGQVFKMDENSVAVRLARMETVTAGKWLWTDTAGLPQIQQLSEIDPLELLKQTYAKSPKKLGEKK